MRTGYLFAGIGCGLLAERLNGHTPVFSVDNDAYRCEVVRQRISTGWFPDLTVHHADVRTFDPAPYTGRVDCLCFSFPCQDLSRMGNGAGLDGARSGLYTEGIRCLRVLRCEYAFIENVTDLLDDGLDRILCDLAALGYDAGWGDIPAAATGASDLRERAWIVAHANQERLQGKLSGRATGGAIERSLLDVQRMADTNQNGRSGLTASGIHGGGNDYWHDADGCLRDPPGREDREGWQFAADHGAPEPGLRRMADETAWRLVKHRVAAIGDGQDPICAAFAWRMFSGLRGSP